MEITDLSWNTNKIKRNNHPLLPKSIRGILIGKSGCGKTTLLLNLLLKPEWLDYDKLFIFGKSLFQPEYKVIKKSFEEQIPKESILKLFQNQDELENINFSTEKILEEIGRYCNTKSNIQSNFYEDSKDVPDPKELNSKDKNLMIFDDLMLEKQNTCESYYIRGRHSNVDCFY